jgi:hypothetical protein
MASSFDVRLRDGTVVVSVRGALRFDETNRSIAAAVEAARAAQTKKIVFDLRAADCSNYYSYTVRHGELAPTLGLDTSFSLAFVGAPQSADVLAFMELVAHNRGWRSRSFTDIDDAMKWAGDAPEEERYGGSGIAPGR